MGQMAIEWNLKKIKDLERDRNLVLFKIKRNKKKVQSLPEAEENDTEVERLNNKINMLEKTLEKYDEQLQSMKSKDNEALLDDLYIYMGVLDHNCSVLFRLK